MELSNCVLLFLFFYAIDKFMLLLKVFYVSVNFFYYSNTAVSHIYWSGFSEERKKSSLMLEKYDGSCEKVTKNVANGSWAD